MHNGTQSGASICDAAAHKLSAAGSKLWGDSLSGDECGTQRVGKDRPRGRRNVPLVDVFIKTEICPCILKCYFSQNLFQMLISKTCLFLSWQLQGCSELPVLADFPHRKGFCWASQGFASKNSELQNNFLNVEIFNLFFFFLFWRPRLRLSNSWLLKKRKRCFRLQNNEEYFVFLRVLQGRSPMGTPTPGMPLLLPLGAAASPDVLLSSSDTPNFTKQTQFWPRKVGEIDKELLCVRLPRLFRADIQRSGSPASPKPALCKSWDEKQQRLQFYLPLIKCWSARV